MCKSFAKVITLLSLFLNIYHVQCKSGRRTSFETLARLAFEHGARVNTDGSCQDPRPQLVYFNDPTKVYLPRATILHRCSDLTGCCPHGTQTCQPIETKTVELYFYTISLRTEIGSRQVHQLQNIDKITFTNHTRCGCQARPGYDMDTNIFESDLHTNKL